MAGQATGRVFRVACRIVAALAVAALGGCDMCEEGDLRCNGHVVQECNEFRNWKDSHDCGTDECGVGRDVCRPLIDLGLGEVWCCYH